MESDPVITAWALNELPLEQQSAMEEALLRNPALRGEAASIQGFCRFMTGQLQDTETTLTDAQRGYITRSADSLRPLRLSVQEPLAPVRSAPVKANRFSWWRENHEVVVPLAAAAVLVLASLWFLRHDEQVNAESHATVASASDGAQTVPSPPPAASQGTASGGAQGASAISGPVEPRFAPSLTSASGGDSTAGDWSRQARMAGTPTRPGSAGGSRPKSWSAVPSSTDSSTPGYFGDSFSSLTRTAGTGEGRAIARLEIVQGSPPIVAGKRTISELDAADDLRRALGPPNGQPGEPVAQAVFRPAIALASSAPSGAYPIARVISPDGHGAAPISDSAGDPTWSGPVRELITSRLQSEDAASRAVRDADLLMSGSKRDARVAASPNGGEWTDAHQERQCHLPLPLGKRSFETLRSRLGSGQHPWPGEIRIEEWINAFAFEDESRAASTVRQTGHPLVVRYEAADSPWRQGSRLLRLRIVGADARSPGLRVRGVSLEFDPVQVSAYRVLGFDNRGQTFPLSPAGPAGPEGHQPPGLAILAEFVPASAPSTGAPLVVTVRYDLPDGRMGTMEAPVRGTGASLAAGSTDMRFTTAVAAFGLVLQNPGRDPVANLLQIRSLARESLGDDRDGRRGEFLLMMDRARMLMSTTAR